MPKTSFPNGNEIYYTPAACALQALSERDIIKKSTEM